jgi:hypothetical protein
MATHGSDITWAPFPLIVSLGRLSTEVLRIEAFSLVTEMGDALASRSLSCTIMGIVAEVMEENSPLSFGGRL